MPSTVAIRIVYSHSANTSAHFHCLRADPKSLRSRPEQELLSSVRHAPPLLKKGSEDLRE